MKNLEHKPSQESCKRSKRYTDSWKTFKEWEHNLNNRKRWIFRRENSYKQEEENDQNQKAKRKLCNFPFCNIVILNKILPCCRKCEEQIKKTKQKNITLLICKRTKKLFENLLFKRQTQKSKLQFESTQILIFHGLWQLQDLLLEKLTFYFELTWGGLQRREHLAQTLGRESTWTSNETTPSYQRNRL